MSASSRAPAGPTSSWETKEISSTFFCSIFGPLFRRSLIYTRLLERSLPTDKISGRIGFQSSDIFRYGFCLKIYLHIYLKIYLLGICFESSFTIVWISQSRIAPTFVDSIRFRAFYSVVRRIDLKTVHSRLSLKMWALIITLIIKWIKMLLQQVGHRQL